MLRRVVGFLYVGSLNGADGCLNWRRTEKFQQKWPLFVQSVCGRWSFFHSARLKVKERGNNNLSFRELAASAVKEAVNILKRDIKNNKWLQTLSMVFITSLEPTCNKQKVLFFVKPFKLSKLCSSVRISLHSVASAASQLANKRPNCHCKPNSNWKLNYYGKRY